MDFAERQARLQQKLQAQKRHEVQRFAERLGFTRDRCLALLPTDVAAVEVEQWWRSAFPWSCHGIDWAAVAHSHCVEWHEENLLAEAFQHLCQKFSLGNPTVTLIGSNGITPLLQMSLSTLHQNAAALYHYDWEVWIVEPEAGWCIESHSQGTVCFGYSPRR